MIGKIQPDVDYKLIKDSAYMTVNLLKNNPNSIGANVVYKQFLSEGKKAPGYAKTIMKLAENDASLKDIRKMLDYKMSTNEFEKRSNNLRDGFINLFGNNTEAEFELNKAGRKMYPKTWDLRCKILNWWKDTSEHRYLTSQFKDLKRDFWGTMKKVNPKIAEIMSKYKN